MTGPRIVHLAITIAALLTTAASAAPPALVGPYPVDTPERLYAWFDRLGYPDLSRARFGLVAGRAWLNPGVDHPLCTDPAAFLISEDDVSFTVFSLSSLQTRTLSKTPPGTPDDARRAFDDHDLASYIDRWLEGSTGRPDNNLLTRSDHYDPLGIGARLFLLVRAAHARGRVDRNPDLTARAAKLLKVVDQLPPPSWTNAAMRRPTAADPGICDVDRSPRSLRLRLANELAFAETWDAIDAFRRRGVDRQDFLVRLEKVLARFPDCDLRREVDFAVTGLRRLVREDEAHAAVRHVEPLELRSTSEQIDEWIYRLRDLDEHVYLQGVLPPHPPENAVHRIAGFGLDAVPQLIGALDHDGFIRGKFPFSRPRQLIWPSTVGEAAQVALEYVSGRRFRLSEDQFQRLTPDQQVAERDRMIRAWYDDMRKRGRKAVLVDEVRRGGPDVSQLAARLAVLYPADATDPILACIQQCESDQIRSTLVRLLENLDGPGIEPFLLDEVRRGPLDDHVMSAAAILLRRSNFRCVPILIERWNRMLEGPAITVRENLSSFRDVRDFAQLLVHSGDPSGVRAITDSFHRIPMEYRVYIINNACESVQAREMPADQLILLPGYDAAIDRLLTAGFDDDREQTYLEFGRESAGLRRVADILGFLLNEAHSDNYPFDIKADLPTRNAALANIRNALGLPPPRPTPRAPTAVTPD